jgi:hypothetical protein
MRDAQDHCLDLVALSGLISAAWPSKQNEFDEPKNEASSSTGSVDDPSLTAMTIAESPVSRQPATQWFLDATHSFSFATKELVTFRCRPRLRG